MTDDSMSDTREPEADAEAAHDLVSDGHLPVGWVVDERAATFIVSTNYNIEFVVSGSLVRLVPGDAIGTGRHVLVSDADNPPSENLGAKTLVDRYAIICEVLEQAATGSLEPSVTQAVIGALAHGRRPRDPANDQQRQSSLSIF